MRSRDRFDQLIVELTEGLPGHRDVHRQQMEFPDYANMKLKVMFFEGFERFITDHPRVLWIAYQIQVRVVFLVGFIFSNCGGFISDTGGHQEKAPGRV